MLMRTCLSVLVCKEVFGRLATPLPSWKEKFWLEGWDGMGWDRKHSHLGEDSKLLARHPLALHLAPHLIIAPLHQRLLQPHRIPHKLILLNRLLAFLTTLQALKQRMETRVITHTQQKQQIQSRDFALIAVLRALRAR